MNDVRCMVYQMSSGILRPLWMAIKAWGEEVVYRPASDSLRDPCHHRVKPGARRWSARRQTVSEILATTVWSLGRGGGLPGVRHHSLRDPCHHRVKPGARRWSARRQTPQSQRSLPPGVRHHSLRDPCHHRVKPGARRWSARRQTVSEIHATTVWSLGRGGGLPGVRHHSLRDPCRHRVKPGARRWSARRQTPQSQRSLPPGVRHHSLRDPCHHRVKPGARRWSARRQTVSEIPATTVWSLGRGGGLPPGVRQSQRSLPPPCEAWGEEVVCPASDSLRDPCHHRVKPGARRWSARRQTPQRSLPPPCEAWGEEVVCPASDTTEIPATTVWSLGRGGGLPPGVRHHSLRDPCHHRVKPGARRWSARRQTVSEIPATTVWSLGRGGGLPGVRQSQRSLPPPCEAWGEEVVCPASDTTVSEIPATTVWSLGRGGGLPGVRQSHRSLPPPCEAWGEEVVCRLASDSLIDPCRHRVKPGARRWSAARRQTVSEIPATTVWSLGRGGGLPGVRQSQRSLPPPCEAWGEEVVCRPASDSLRDPCHHRVKPGARRWSARRQTVSEIPATTVWSLGRGGGLLGVRQSQRSLPPPCEAWGEEVVCPASDSFRDPCRHRVKPGARRWSARRQTPQSQRSLPPPCEAWGEEVVCPASDSFRDPCRHRVKPGARRWSARRQTPQSQRSLPPPCEAWGEEVVCPASDSLRDPCHHRVKPGARRWSARRQTVSEIPATTVWSLGRGGGLPGVRQSQRSLPPPCEAWGEEVVCPASDSLRDPCHHRVKPGARRWSARRQTVSEIPATTVWSLGRGGGLPGVRQSQRSLPPPCEAWGEEVVCPASDTTVSEIPATTVFHSEGIFREDPPPLFLLILRHPLQQRFGENSRQIIYITQDPVLGTSVNIPTKVFCPPMYFRYFYIPMYFRCV